MTLISLASRQIWPQVLAVLHYRPARIVLFHSEDLVESKQPAQRLQKLFNEAFPATLHQVEQTAVPHDGFKGVVDSFASTAKRIKLDSTNCIVNLTGGNKLMAMAAAEWCRLAGVPCFYLERDFRVFPFNATATDLLPQPEFKLDPHLAKNVNPVTLLRCQLGDAEVIDPGQRLTLNAKGKKLPDLEIKHLISRDEDFQKFMEWDIEILKKNAGDNLELATAFVLLKLGIPSVQRSVRLAPKLLRGIGKEEGELDLVFNWLGKLWIVDCKNRRTAEQKVDSIRTEIVAQTSLSPRLDKMLADLTNEIRIRDLSPLKHDLLAVSEVGGLLGQSICVRRDPLPAEASDFAKSRRIPVALKGFLLRDLQSILNPNQPASLEQLQALAATRTRASA